MPEPLYRLQARALRDDAAAQECAERYARGVAPAYTTAYTLRFTRRMVAWYLAGLKGERRTEQSNYDRPLERAWREGRDLRTLLLAEQAQTLAVVAR